jgi:hypothetical protein
LAIESNWNRHAVRLETGAEFGFFSHDSDDDYIDYFANFDGVIDITRKAYINGGFGYAHGHEARGTDDVPGTADEPVEFDGFSGDILGEVSTGRFRFQAFANAEDLNFDDVSLIGGGTSNQDDRDRFEFESGIEVGYSVRSGYEAFIRASYLMTDYDDAVDDGGVDRDSNGFRVLAGLKIDLTRLIEASVGLGYEELSYDDSTLDDDGSFAANVGVEWSVTPITTISFNASSSIMETTVTGASGAATTLAEIGVSHELRRNLTLQAFGGFEYIDFVDTSRDDQIYSVGIGAEWKITRRLSLEPSYDFQLRDSNAVDLDYTDHRATLSLTYGF